MPPRLDIPRSRDLENVPLSSAAVKLSIGLPENSNRSKNFSEPDRSITSSVGAVAIPATLLRRAVLRAIHPSKLLS